MKKNSLQKLVALVLALVLSMALVACGGGNNSTTQQSSNAQNSGDTSSSSNTNDGSASANTDDGSGSGSANSLSNYLPAVTDAYGHSATKKHDSVTLAANGDPGNLLPQDTHFAGKEILNSIFEPLYVIDGFGGDLLPLIAADMPVDNGDGTYDITIRDNIYDSDGNHMTASDIAFSYTWLVTNSTPHNMGKLKSVEPISDYVARFHCDTLNGVSDLGNLFAQQYMFTEKAFNDHDFATDPVGTGPYKLVSFTAGSEAKLEARNDYWCEGEEYQLARFRANVQNVTYKILTDASQQANAMRTGELDYSNSLTEADLEDFLNDGAYADKFNAFPYLDNLTYYLLPNCDPASPCSDVNLRRAIMYAVDGAVCAVASGNASAQVVYDLYNSKFPETKEAWSTTEDTYYTNPSLETAKSYLDQSNYNNETLVLLTRDAPAAAQNVSTVICTVLQSIGINCTLDIVNNSMYSERTSDPTSFDLLVAMMAADDYGVVVYNRLMGADSYGGGQETINFITDSELQRLITLCNTAETHTDENVQALHDYMIENAYGRGLLVVTCYNVMSDSVVEICNNFKNYCLPGGCVYADNEF